MRRGRRSGCRTDTPCRGGTGRCSAAPALRAVPATRRGGPVWPRTGWVGIWPGHGRCVAPPGPVRSGRLELGHPGRGRGQLPAERGQCARRLPRLLCGGGPRGSHTRWRWTTREGRQSRRADRRERRRAGCRRSSCRSSAGDRASSQLTEASGHGISVTPVALRRW